MDKGKIVEFDSPANLQANPTSAFNGLLKSVGK
jgi:ABC-type multidrug transport system fused ATPase/permease subunit